jgi:hypothetical protein
MLFADQVRYATGSSPSSVAIGDLSGDGHPDLAVANLGSNSVTVLCNASTGPGDIAFVPRLDLATGPLTSSVAIGDLDGDGPADLAVLTSGAGTLNVFRNIGPGSFASPEGYVVDGTSSFIAIGDLDGDVRPDLVIANPGSDSVSVLRNSSGVGTLDFASRVDIASGAQPIFVAIADLDGDGSPDIAAVNARGYSVSIHPNLGNGTFEDARMEYPTGSGSNSVAIGDLDGDARPDLALANRNDNSVSVLRNTSEVGTVDFAARTDIASGSRPRSVVLGDVDGDGRPDLAVANPPSDSVSVMRNVSVIGEIAFATRVDVAVGSSPRSVAIGDLNGDGHADLAVANGNSDTVSVLPNGGDGTFAARTDWATDEFPVFVALSDLDADSRLDLVVVNHDSVVVSVLRNISPGGGDIAFESRLDFVADIRRTSVAIDDLDGDGRVDLVLAGTTNTFSVLRNISEVGAIEFAPAIYFNHSVQEMGLSIAIDDLDGDGRRDFAVASNARGRLSVLRNCSQIGYIAFAGREDYATGGQPLSVGIGDLDGDGYSDLALATDTGRSASVLQHLLPSDPSPNPGPAPTACPGDASCDRVVNFDDLTAVLCSFGSTAAPYGPGDADGSGLVNFDDMTTVLANFGNVCGP